MSRLVLAMCAYHSAALSITSALFSPSTSRSASTDINTPTKVVTSLNAHNTPAEDVNGPKINAPKSLTLFQAGQFTKLEALNANAGANNSGVYFATFEGRRVVLKVSDPHEQHTDDEKDVFEMVESNRHLPGSEYIVKCFGYFMGKFPDESGRVRDHVVFVLEKMDDDLFHFVRKYDRRGMKEEDVRLIGQQIAAGVAFLHSLNIVHTDLKEANIFLGYSDIYQDDRYIRPSNPIVKIGDFGNCYFSTHPDSTIVVRPNEITTISHRSPEAFAGVGVTSKTDIWSIGVILAELLKGEAFLFAVPGWDSREMLDVIKAKLGMGAAKENIPLVSELSSHPEFIPIIRACLSMNPAERPTAAGLRDLLADLSGK